MLDFIFNNIFIDIGAIYNFDGIVNQLNRMGATRDTGVASYIESNIDKIESDIQKLIESVFE